jgi:hypothetical protein
MVTRDELVKVAALERVFFEREMEVRAEVVNPELLKTRLCSIACLRRIQFAERSGSRAISKRAKVVSDCESALEWSEAEPDGVRPRI